jgi:hypothetical protein
MYCCFVLFYVLFVCIRVLYYCHWVPTQLQLTNIPALTRLQATSPTHTFRTADLDLAHTSPSYTNDLYSYTITACTVEAPDDG